MLIAIGGSTGTGLHYCKHWHCDNSVVASFLPLLLSVVEHSTGSGSRDSSISYNNLLNCINPFNCKVDLRRRRRKKYVV